MWDVEGTDEFADWYANELTRPDQVRVEAAIEALCEEHLAELREEGLHE